MKPLIVVGDVRPFVLGDEGVLFSESRQELYTLNTSATLLWCLLEQGVTLDGLVDAYSGTFDLPRMVAEQHVYPMLRRWYGLGHLDDPDVPGAGQMPLSEALACLLTNARLRERFRAAPVDVGAALGVAAEDRAALVALDAEALDGQADDLLEHRRRRRQVGAPGTISLDATDLLDCGGAASMESDVVRRYFRLLDVTFDMTLSPALDARVHAALAHLEVEARPADVVFHVRESNGGCVVFDGLLPVACAETPRGLVPSLKNLLRRLAVARRPYFIEIHAGVVRLGDEILLLPGSAGHGKTTLTAALSHGDGLYLSDEIGLLDRDSLGVLPMPLAMTIKPGSVEPLRHLYPSIALLEEHVREDHQPVRYLAPPRNRCEYDQTPRPARWVVFPHYEPGVDTQVTALSPTEGLTRLLDESLVLPTGLGRSNVAMLVDWVRQLDFYDLRLSSLEPALQAIRQVVSRHANPPRRW
jgi:hypothetical protein